MDKPPLRICMISCRHALTDDRIYKKEALTLARNGYELIHIGYGSNNCDNCDDLPPDGIRLIELRKEKWRGQKFSLHTLSSAFRQLQMKDLFRAAALVAADVYHLHDVELCRIAPQLQQLPHRPKVIYDAHEPFVDNLLDSWRRRSPLMLLLNDLPALMAEKRFLKKADYLIATEENVAARFRKHNPRTAILYNYSYFPVAASEESEKIYDVIYAGRIAESKGAFLMLNALIAAQKQGKRCTFAAVGPFASPALRAEMEAIVRREGMEDRVVFTGEIPLEDVRQYYLKSRTAFCLLPPNRANRKILPIKLFEYAACGLPIIGSHFGHVGEIIRSNRIGCPVDPLAADDVAAALLSLLAGTQYDVYSRNGRQCVNDRYLWKTQERELLRIYGEMEEPGV